MQVNITANTIQQIINADTVNLDQIRKLTPQEQSNIIEGLINYLKEQTEKLIKDPLADDIGNSIKSIDIKDKDRKVNKEKIDGIVKNIKDYIGNTADILLNAVKMCAITGRQPVTDAGHGTWCPSPRAFSSGPGLISPL